MLKPIETVFKGYRFRSRLEARWAVFFETLGIPWEYEKEGFNLDGTYYLPDFYLPDIDTWIEIKPGDPDIWPEHIVFDLAEGMDEKKWATFPFHGFVLIVGQPWTNLSKQYPSYDDYEYNGYVYGDCNYYFCECPVCGKIGIQYDARGGRICGKKCCPNSGKDYNPLSPRLQSAYLAARKARFEHGECG